MSMYGDDYEYARTRLENTIVRDNKGEPLYIHRLEHGGECLVGYLKEGNLMEKIVRINLELINCKPVPLGYVNTAGKATYLMRIPMRKDWKQGLRAANCASSAEPIFEMCNKALANCIKGVYPTFKSTLTEITKSPKIGRSYKIIAFHRHWALSGDGSVLYRNNLVVGKLVEGSIVLNDSFNYLRESLNEVV